jgi:hypothetical protein
MNGREDEEEVGNVGSEHENMRQKLRTVKTMKLRQMIGVVNSVRLVNLNKGQ